MLLLAVAFLVAYAWPVVDESLDAHLRSFLTAFSWSVYAAFAVDFIVRLVLADRRSAYAKAHWYDVGLIALPVLRPLRLLRLLALARILNRSAANSLVGRVSAYVIGAAIMAWGLGALAVLDAEKDAKGANITSFGDALWWSTTTIMTVGYGDRYPVTTTGRIVAGGLMVVGIALIGAVTATVAAWLVSQVQREQESRPSDPGANTAPHVSEGRRTD